MQLANLTFDLHGYLFNTRDYLKLDKVLWSALPQLLLTEISMIFVVALSSCKYAFLR